MQKLMIIEDDPMVMDIHRQFVEKSGGFEIVATTHTGANAVELAKRHCPDVALLDIYLPDMDGISVLKAMRNQELPIDVILITAARDAATIQTAFRYGAVDYIIKPFKYERLQQALQTYLTMYNALGQQTPFSQSEIDQLAGSSVQSNTRKLDNYTTFSDLPKGLNELTLKQVVIYLLKENSALSADEVAEGIGLARVTARRYLEFLEQSNKVKLEVQYGSVGRPINRYRPLMSK